MIAFKIDVLPPKLLYKSFDFPMSISKLLLIIFDTLLVMIILVSLLLFVPKILLFLNNISFKSNNEVFIENAYDDVATLTPNNPSLIKFIFDDTIFNFVLYVLLFMY